MRTYRQNVREYFILVSLFLILFISITGAIAQDPPPDFDRYCNENEPAQATAKGFSYYMANGSKVRPRGYVYYDPDAGTSEIKTLMPTGEYDQFIIYDGLFNPETDEYDYYAIDKNGNARPVYMNGDKIYYMVDNGSADNHEDLLWEVLPFTEDGTKDSDLTGYFVLRSVTEPHKFMAPQPNNVFLSNGLESIILQGIMMGNYSSTIEMWNPGGYFGLDLVRNGTAVNVITTKDDIETFKIATVDDPGTTIGTAPWYSENGMIARM